MPVPLVLAFLAWGAVAGQVAAVAFGRYMPYPEPAERFRGPIRESIRRVVLLRRRARARRQALRVVDEPDADAEQRRGSLKLLHYVEI